MTKLYQIKVREHIEEIEAESEEEAYNAFYDEMCINNYTPATLLDALLEVKEVKKNA